MNISSKRHCFQVKVTKKGIFFYYIFLTDRAIQKEFVPGYAAVMCSDGNTTSVNYKKK